MRISKVAALHDHSAIETLLYQVETLVGQEIAYMQPISHVSALRE
jgi:hypothetical protein